MILNIVKPKGWSSFDVVKKVRGITRHKKVGHAGTLDPFATGVLIIGTEKDTKKLGQISSNYKTYEATLKLGEATNTLDIDGEIVNSLIIPKLTSNEINEILKSFLGNSLQIPPMFSAKKYKGIRLYKLARKGIEVKRKPIIINIKKIDLISFKKNSIKFSVECSKGTYVRVLGENIAQKLNTIGYLSALKRIKVGNFDISNSITIQALEEKWKF